MVPARFYAEQPDLNVANPAVRDELVQIAGFWLRQGLSGFRVDAVPLIEPVGMHEGAIQDPHELLRDLRAYLGRRDGEAVLLGEVNLPPADQAPFSGSGGSREVDLLFTFHAMQALYVSLAREDATPLEEATARLPEIPHECRWAGENLAIEGRLAVRSPMPWSSGPRGGFSSAADPAALCRPVVDADGFGPEAVSRTSAARTTPC